MFKFIAFILLTNMLLTVQGCVGNKSSVQKETVDTVLTVSIYPTDDKENTIIPMDSVLLEEMVHITEIMRYGSQDSITVPFHFSNVARYADITGTNIDRRIAIAVNGEVVYTPVVKMRLDNGECSVVLSKVQALKLLPKEKVEDLLTN